GTTALDGDGNNSPYTLALAQYLPVPDLDVRVMFGRVRDRVRKVTNNQQNPNTYGSIGGDLPYFVPSAPRPPRPGWTNRGRPRSASTAIAAGFRQLWSTPPPPPRPCGRSRRIAPASSASARRRACRSARAPAAPSARSLLPDRASRRCR